jgi:RNA polymerase sigma-B factor
MSRVAEATRTQSRTADDRRLFRRYRATGDPIARRELIERQLPLAHKLARRYARSADAGDDLRQVAALGLIKAIDRYDPDRGTAFAGFAIPTILGEIKRHFRDTRWAVHIPRDLQERAQAVEREAERLTQELKRPPAVAEVAASLALSPEEVIEARAAFTGMDVASLDTPVASGDDGSELTVADRVGAVDAGYEAIEDREAVAPALAQLHDRDRMALRLAFVDDLTQREIGERLNVSQMQVSRMIRRSLSDIRAAVAAA